MAEGWKPYFRQIVRDRKIDLDGAIEESVRLQEYAIAEVGNRLLGGSIFDTRPVETWVDEFLPYASKVERETVVHDR